MRRLIYLIIGVLLATVSVAYADTYPVGAGVAVKIEYLHFTQGTLKDLNAENGVYVGVEAYKQLFLPDLYFGVEAGWVGTSGNFTPEVSYFYFDPITGSFRPVDPRLRVDTDVTYVPIEFNSKYVIPINELFSFHVGGGLSCNYFSLETYGPPVVLANVGRRPKSITIDSSDWVLGGQFFAGLDYKFRNWFAGVGIKYQMTDTPDVQMVSIQGPVNLSADNMRVGVKIGCMF